MILGRDEEVGLCSGLDVVGKQRCSCDGCLNSYPEGGRREVSLRLQWRKKQQSLLVPRNRGMLAGHICDLDNFVLLIRVRHDDSCVLLLS